MKRLLILSVMMIFAVGAVFAGGDAEAGSAEERGPIKVKVLFDTETTETSLDSDIGQMIYDALGVEIESVTFSGDRREKALTMLAGQDFGDLDIMVVANHANATKYIAAGALVNLDDYKDKLPNYYSYCAEYIPYLRLYDPEGGLYLWQAGPDIKVGELPYDMIVRSDVLEALDWPRLDTTGDYVDFLEKALEMFPETDGLKTIGMTVPGNGTLGTRLLSYLPRHGGFQMATPYGVYIDVDNDKYVSLPESPYYKETLRFWNELSRKGLLDPEAFTSTLGDQGEKMKAGYSVVNFFPHWLVRAANLELEATGRENMQYITLPIRLDISKENRKARYEASYTIRPDNLTGILSSAPQENIERIIEVVNFMSSEEMTLRLGWGKENDHYTVAGDSQRTLTDEFYRLQKNDPDRLNAIRGSFLRTLFPTKNNGITSNGQSSRAEGSVVYGAASTTKRQQEVLNAYGWNNYLSPWKDSEYFDFQYYDVTLAFSASILDPNSDIGFKSDSCALLLDELYPLVVIAKTEAEFEARYADMVAQIKKAGIDDVVDFINDNYSKTAEKIAGFGG